MSWIVKTAAQRDSNFSAKSRVVFIAIQMVHFGVRFQHIVGTQILGAHVEAVDQRSGVSGSVAINAEIVRFVDGYPSFNLNW